MKNSSLENPSLEKERRKILPKFFTALFEPDDYLVLVWIPERGTNGRVKDENVSLEKALSIVLDPRSYRKSHYLCFTPNPIKKGKRRSIENVASLNCLFVDVDQGLKTKNPNLPPAQFHFSRDENHHHFYFPINRLAPTDKSIRYYTDTAKLLIADLGGDKGVHDPSRVLRIPYSPHNKDGVESLGYTLCK